VRRRFRVSHPAFLISATTSLAVGLAISFAAFSILNSLVFAPLVNVNDRGSLVKFVWTGGGSTALNQKEFDALRATPPTNVTSVVAQGERQLPVLRPEGSTVALVSFVSPELFSVLGAAPLQGRLLNADDGDPGAAPVAVLGEAFWQRAFDGGAVLGHTLVVGGDAFTVVGIIAAQSPGLRPIDVGAPESQYPQVWLPLAAAASLSQPSDVAWLSVAGRFADGASMRTLSSELKARAAGLSSTASRDRTTLSAFRAGLDWRRQPDQAFLVTGLYLLIPMCILAIACLNVVGLQIARALEQTSELSTRLALGAPRLHLVWTMTVDVLLATAIAVPIGWLGARVLLTQATQYLPFNIAIDGAVFVFVTAIVMLVVAGAGFFPAWLTSRHVVATGLRAQVHGELGRGRLRRSILVVQIAASIAALGLSATVIRSVVGRQPDLPDGADKTLMVDLNLSTVRPNVPYATEPFAEGLLTALDGSAGIRSAGLASFGAPGRPLSFRFHDDGPRTRRSVSGGFVTPGWFDAMDVRLLAGRLPERHLGEREAIVNAAFAAEFPGGPDATLGASIVVSNDDVMIVGIVANTERTGTGAPVKLAYLSMPTAPPPNLVLAVRAEDPDAARGRIVTAIRELDPLVPAAHMTTLDQRVTEETAGLRHTAAIGMFLGLLALALAASGLHALLSWEVRRRQREIGVRLALGAQLGKVVWLTLAPGMALLLVGGAAGSAAAWAASALVRAWLLGVSSLDPWALAPSLLALLAAALVAGAPPAYRAVRLDSVRILRDE
jgi:predicted permease